MSRRLISLNDDLRRLEVEGFSVEIRGGFLLVHDIPYVNSRREVAQGIFVCALNLAGERTVPPSDHTMNFVGDHPCYSDGNEILTIKHSSTEQALLPDLRTQHMFSNKPAGGYADYFEKVSRYALIVCGEAASLDPHATPRVHRPIVSEEENSPFVYLDTASSRAGIVTQTARLHGRISIIGLGGTGSYILDLVAKTPVAQIDLYDADDFLQHNAFRAPGAASLTVLAQRPSKVVYLAETYASMHRGIVPHAYHLSHSNVSELGGSSFVFVCIDAPEAKRPIVEFLMSSAIPFIDVGMGIQCVPESSELLGSVRVTAVTPEYNTHVAECISTGDTAENDLYRQNIQVADLNALNAALAVIKWKKIQGFYQDLEREHDSVYATNVHQLTCERGE